jgi:hypothetical protein
MNRFLDDSNIKKIPPAPPAELIKQTINTPKQKSEVRESFDVIMSQSTDKEKEFKEELEKINDEVDFKYPEHGVNIQMTTKTENKEKKPLYQVSRNNGKVEVQTELFKTQIDKVNIVDRKNTLQMMINKSRNDLIEQQIELEIISQMRTKVEENRKKAFDAKMKSQTEKVKETSLRISILETIIKSEVKK